MNVVALGRTATLYNAIEEVVEAGYELELIITCGAESHYSVGEEDFRALADRVGAAFLVTNRINDRDIIQMIDDHDPDIGISVNWKTLIGRKTRNCFTHGIINAHTGDLPRFRGNAATNWALIVGEETIVYTLHFMEDELDAGPILLQRSMEVDNETRIKDVYEFGREQYPEMFVEALQGLESGTISPTPQPTDDEHVLRCYPRLPIDSRLDWTESADRLDRIVRASSEPLFGAFTYFNGKRLRVWRAHSEPAPSPYLGTPGQVAERRPAEGEVAVITGDGFLVLETVETAESNGRVPATEIIGSNRDRLGMVVTEEIHTLRDRVRELERQIDE